MMIEYGKKMSIGAYFDINVEEWDRGSCFCCLFDLKFFGGIWIKSC